MRTYPDGRPAPCYRLDAIDHGRIFVHGDGPDRSDALGAREASVVLHDDVFHLFYDGAEPDVGWRACLATSADLKTWHRHGPVLDFGEQGQWDSHTATSPWFIHHDDRWHAYYVGCMQTSPPPNCIPGTPYYTLKAEASQLTGPFHKRRDVQVTTVEPGTYHSDTACPGYLFWYENRLWQFFSAAQHVENDAGRTVLQRTLGLAHAMHPDGPWIMLDQPILPQQEQVENSSLYHEPANDLWFLFTNHIGTDDAGSEWTDAIWVYWSDNPTRWNPSNKAIVLDGENCSWSEQCIGMPSVVRVGDRLAMFYDAPGSDSRSHVNRDIGLAWFDLPLCPPKEGSLT